MDYHLQVPELTRVEICWETVKGGQSKETFFVMSPEDWNQEHEGFIGLLLEHIDNYWGRHYKWSKPVRVVFDGMLYVNRITKKEVIEELGEDVFETKMQRAEAVLTLVKTSEPDSYPIMPDQEQIRALAGVGKKND